MRLRIAPCMPVYVTVAIILSLYMAACTPVEPPIAPVVEEGAAGESEAINVTAVPDSEPDSGVSAVEAGRLARGQALIDWDFRNQDGEVSGEIEDFFVEIETGRIPFVIVEYGGVLDIGDREIAVPLRAFAWGSEDELVLNLDEQALATFPDLGDDWPDFTDPGWDDDVMAFWSETGIDPGRDSEATTGLIVSASDLINVAIVDFGAGGGLVQDVLIDLAEGRAVYLLVGFGASTPVNDPQILPMGIFSAEAVGDELLLRGDASLESLETAPRFDLDRYDGVALMPPEFGPELESHWR